MLDGITHSPHVMMTEIKLVYKPPSIEEINSSPALKKKYELALKICQETKIVKLGVKDDCN